MKTGILVAAAGTRDPQGRAALDHVVCRARKRLPGMAMRWSYTATVVRKRLAAEGLVVPSPGKALAQMAADGFLRVAIWSLHVVPGREYHELVLAARTAENESGSRLTVCPGRPLLSSYDDLERVADAILADRPAECTDRDAVILVGHGNMRHPADLAYAAAAHVFTTLAPRVYIATVSGRPGLDDLLRQCRASGVTRAYLLPFTTVAGSTVREVVAASGEKSWRPRLAEAGLEIIPVLKGLVEREGVADVWLDHLVAAVEALSDT